MLSPPVRNDRQRVADEYSAIRQEEVVDYRGTAESMLPLAEASVVQLKPGPAPTNLEIFSSDKIAVMGLHHHVASIGVVVFKPDCFGFMWWDGNEKCRINGELARRTVIYSQGEQGGFHAAGGARQTMGIVVRRNDFIESLAALRGVGPEDVGLKRAALELLPGAAARFRYDVNKILSNAVVPGSDSSITANPVNPGDAMFGLLVEAYLQASPASLREDRPRRPEQIVRRAEERFFSAKGSPVSLADLCAATGVSQSTLYRAFDTVCGEPPLAYFHKRRLAEARRALLKSPPCRGGVKRAAISAGMTEFGRFSVEYRQLFGESPSTTLDKDLTL